MTTRYRGAHARIEDGVRYRPLGLAAGYYASIITYHLSLPFVVAMSNPDLVVEDFAAPMSSILSPLWTRRPTIAVVQWLFAGLTSARYRMPFFLVEALGLRLHRRFIAASGYMASEILARNPGADVRVIYAGVDPIPAITDAKPHAADILYLGRLQAGPKGLDLLFEAFADLLVRHPDVRLTVAGDGPDEKELRQLARSLGIADRVTFVGRVAGARKWELLRSATALAVPSRYESFGLVAAEALAAATPVVAFDIPSMREIVTEGCGELVPRFDVTAFAAALAGLVDQPALGQAMGEAGQARAREFEWDEAARRQEAAYLAAVDAGRTPICAGRRHGD